MLRLFLGTAAACAATLPSPAHAENRPNASAYVPLELLTGARADPSRTFAVIVQGRPGRSSKDVAGDVEADAEAPSGKGHGVGRRFRSINGVSAMLSGKEILKLARRDDIVAITRDEHMALGDISLPVIEGEARAWRTLTAMPPSPVEPGVDYAYEWQRCDWTGTSCTPIVGADSPTLALALSYIGSTIRVSVTPTAGAAAGQTTTSTPTDPVAPLFALPFWNVQLWPYSASLQSVWAQLGLGAYSGLPTIAIVDSGVDGTAPGLNLSKQLTFTNLTPNAEADGRGHGTFVASIAAGTANAHAGAAPGAPVVSLDVMDDNGRATTSDVIAAADWIYENKDAYGIRVANFSLVGTIPTSFRYDPLDKAVEKLWLSGVVVVAAAGNYAHEGAASGVRYAPGNDPFIITVGAADTGGTLSTADDQAAPWSAYGYTPDGLVKPELGAPGRYMIGAVPPSSTLATGWPDKVVAPGYMELSGTSFAAPVVAGMAADLLAAHPNWTPGEVKGALMLRARPVAAASGSLGVGEVSAGGAIRVDAPPDADQALESFLVPDPLGGPTPVFDAEAWKAAVDANPNWAAEMWGSSEMWGSASWSAEMWGSSYWSAAMVSSEMWGSDAGSSDSTSAEMWGSGDPALRADSARPSTMSVDDWAAVPTP